MSTPLRIAVTGLAATYPLGGVFWDYMQYVLGLRRLGHEVLYLEDTGKWCYDPVSYTFLESGAKNAAYLAKHIAMLDPGLSDSWYFRDGMGQSFGKNWEWVKEFCRTADLFLHISASCWMRDEYLGVSRVAFFDSDPMYTQASVPAYLDGTISDEARSRVDKLLEHDVFFTFAENIGKPDCLIPTGLFNWIPTRQPIVLDCFENSMVASNHRRGLLTTVASWEPTEKGPVVAGVPYYGKSVEFERFMQLNHFSSLPIELALSGRVPLQQLQDHGWLTVDALGISHDPWVYRDYLAHSFGEWSVAKNAYVRSRSGWFSCRSACYLALGVPVIVQDTGFGDYIPTGEGIQSFTTMEQAIEAIEKLRTDPDRHIRAALELAREYFDAGKVLSLMIEQALG